MNETNTTQTTEYVWRRLNDPVRLPGVGELPWWVWLLLLGVVLAAAFVYVVWMYVKDSRGVGPVWAVFLGTLRTAVYAILAVVFLLPALQTWEESQVRGKVLVVFDASNSVSAVVDDPPEGGVTPLTRQDKVIAFLAQNDGSFLARLEAKNPTTAYRIAVKPDDAFLHFQDGSNGFRKEREDRLNDPNQANTPLPAGPLPRTLWEAWLKPNTPPAPPDDWGDADKERLRRLVESNKKLAEAGFFNGTNLGDSLLALLNREVNNEIQGVVVFTDGRSTQGSLEAFGQLEQRARTAKIPVFVVGVGEDRPQVQLEILDVRVPPQVQPEDRFRLAVELTGVGKADAEVPVTLELVYTKKGKNGQEEELPILLVEAENKADPNKPRQEVDLGKKVVIRPPAPVRFDRGSPPRAEVEFPLDAAALAEAAGVTLDKAKRWELGETKEGEFKFRAHVPKDRLETFVGKEHVSDAADLRVVKRPVRVLLFASAPTRDYQFVRTLLVREVEKKRAELAVHIQLPPGRTERRTGVVQDIPPERLLGAFPNRLDTPSDDPNEKLYDLAEYDVIVAFDPDWSQLNDAQLKLVEKWVEKGGGLIVLGGPINTVELARPKRTNNPERLRPILDLYPVKLADIRIEEMDRSAVEPFALTFDGATPEMEFLKLDEGSGEKGAPAFLDDWKEFFYGAAKSGTVVRGFYNYYPVENAKTGAQVVARFTDPRAKLKDGTTQQPYLVISDPNSGRRVIWLGSGETWRLRQYREAYHERFWAKLVRYAGARNQGKLSRRIDPRVGRYATANRPFLIEAKVEGKGGEPLGPRAKQPVVKIILPTGANPADMKTEVEMKPAGAGREGVFQVRVVPRTAGEYAMEIKSPETGDAVSQRFTVKEANPEMDNTSPDFPAMYRLASPATEVLVRVGEATRTELTARLQRPRFTAEAEQRSPPAAAAPAEEKGDAREEPYRLYFDLKNADLIPDCMTPKVSTRRSRGPVVDQWDQSWPVNGLWDWAYRLVGSEPPSRPVEVPVVLAAVVGLLSVEWLTRKLLRLA